MATEKLISIMKKTLEKSRSGSIPWKDTSDEDTFVASFPDCSVTIKRSETLYSTCTFRFSVIDSQGRELELMEEQTPATDWDNDDNVRPDVKKQETPFMMLQEMFTLARRQGLKVDETLDHVLETLAKR